MLVWDKTLADKRFDDPFAMNTAGVAAAIRYGVDGAVLALAPDASVLWERPFGSRERAFADIDEGGVVVAASLSWPPHVIRLASDGAVLWDKTIELPMLADGHVSAVATNEAGAIALAIGATLHDTQVALALRLGPDGEVTALHACDPTSDGQGIALDEAGTIWPASSGPRTASTCSRSRSNDRSADVRLSPGSDPITRPRSIIGDLPAKRSAIASAPRRTSTR